MITTIISCIIANILTALIVVAVAVFYYKKNQAKIEEKIDKLEDKIKEVKDSFETVFNSMNNIDDIKKKIDELLEKLS